MPATDLLTCPENILHPIADLSAFPAALSTAKGLS